MGVYSIILVGKLLLNRKQRHLRLVVFETPMSSPPEEEELYSTTDQQDKQGSEVNPHRPQKKFVELLLLQSTFRVLQWRIRRRIDFIDAVQSIVSELNTKKIESNQNCPKENDTGIDTGIDNLAYLLTSREFGPFT